jgi:hypothetical protein
VEAIVSKPKLTVKQAKLVKGIAEGKPKQVAALEAGYGTNPNSAAAIASETLKIPSVQEALHTALVRAGITPDLAIAPIGEALLHDDLDMRLKGSDRALKLMVPKNEGNTINNFGTIVAEMRDKYAD